MSLYTTSRAMWEITREKELATRFQADPEAVLDGLDLTDVEHKALATNDIRALFELGIHPFVLYHFALRLAGGFSLSFIQQYLGELQGLTVGDLET